MNSSGTLDTKYTIATKHESLSSSFHVMFIIVEASVLFSQSLGVMYFIQHTSYSISQASYFSYFATSFCKYILQVFPLLLREGWCVRSGGIRGKAGFVNMDVQAAVSWGRCGGCDWGGGRCLLVHWQVLQKWQTALGFSTYLTGLITYSQGQSG